MAYILAHTDEEIAQVHEDTTTLGSPAFTDMPGGSPNPQSGEMRIIAAIAFAWHSSRDSLSWSSSMLYVRSVSYTLLKHAAVRSGSARQIRI